MGLSSLAALLTPIARDLITQAGEAVTIVREIPGEFVPSTGEPLPSSFITYTAYGVPENYRSLEINQTTVLQGDLKVTIYKTDQVPEVNDTLTINAIDYRVINVDRIRVNGADVIYQMQVRV